MKKNIALILFNLLIILLASAKSAAAEIITINTPTPILGGAVNASQVVNFILNVLVAIGIIASIIFLIIGGIKWTTSGGDKMQVEAARNQIVASVVGLVVIIMSFIILRFVLGFLGADLNNLLNIPIANLQ